MCCVDGWRWSNNAHSTNEQHADIRHANIRHAYIGFNSGHAASGHHADWCRTNKWCNVSCVRHHHQVDDTTELPDAFAITTKLFRKGVARRYRTDVDANEWLDANWRSNRRRSNSIGRNINVHPNVDHMFTRVRIRHSQA